MKPPRGLIWAVFAVIAAFPMAYLGHELAWNGWTILCVLVWGAVVAGIAVEIDRRR